MAVWHVMRVRMIAGQILLGILLELGSIFGFDTLEYCSTCNILGFDTLEYCSTCKILGFDTLEYSLCFEVFGDPTFEYSQCLGICYC